MTFNGDLERRFDPIFLQRTINARFREFRKFSETLNGRLPLKHGSDRPETLPKRVSDDSRHFIFRRRKPKFFSIFLQTLKVRLPPEDGSVWPETLGKRVSEDPRHFIFRRQEKIFDKKFRQKHFCSPTPRKSVKCLFWRTQEL